MLFEKELIHFLISQNMEKQQSYFLFRFFLDVQSLAKALNDFLSVAQNPQNKYLKFLINYQRYKKVYQ